jgi:methionyl-tRNA synthetase
MMLERMGIPKELRMFAGIQSHWYSPLAESGFRLEQPVGLFPRLEMPAEDAAA